MGVETGADRGASERQARQLVDRGTRPAYRFLHLARVAAELLAEPDRGRVLEVGATGLDDRPELFALDLERALQALERGDQLVLDRRGSRDLDRGRDDVVRGLAQVDVIVGVDELGAALSTQDLRRAVGDDLVGVGVGRGARASLVDVDRKLVVELSVDDLLGGRRDGSRPPPRSRPSSRLVCAAARLTRPSARMKRRGKGWPEMGS
jgi:hypothetical protein